MSARVIEACNAAVDVIRSEWNPIGPNNVSREYGPSVVLSDDSDTPLSGRQVFVFPAGYAAPEMLSRSGLLRTVTIAVLVVERYTDAAGSPPVAWMDERVEFVQNQIFNVLRNPELMLLGSLMPSPDTPGVVDVVYDVDLYIQNHTFWSQSTFTFQEITDYSGGVA